MNEKRIAIVGISGPGKSTFSRKLATKTGLTLYHMDLLFWKENWKAVPEEEYLKAHTELVKKDTWIIEGYIDKSMSVRA
jgi:adenylate kinase family enzyme